MTRATARNTILSLEKQVLWQHSIPERTESDNKTQEELEVIVQLENCDLFAITETW